MNSVHVTILGLSVLSIRDHFLLKTNQDFLHSGFRVPFGEQTKLASFDGSIVLVNRWNVDFWVEANCWGDCWVVWTTGYGKEIDAAIEVGVGGSNDCTVPVSESLIISFVQSVWNALVWKRTFLCFFQLFVESESSWHYSKRFWLRFSFNLSHDLKFFLPSRSQFLINRKSRNSSKLKVSEREYWFSSMNHNYDLES